MKINFKKTVVSVEFFAPPDFKPEKRAIEYREDPLTGRKSRIDVERTKRVKQAYKDDDTVFRDVVKESEDHCFFCPQNIERSTPKFPSYIGEERIKVGETVLFPNLFPFAEFHAIGTITRGHFLHLDEFTPVMIQNNLKACLKYMKIVYTEKKARYPMYNWNYLPSSAASIIHPHIQLLIEREPSHALEDILNRSRAYYEENGSNYWEDLISQERDNNERFIYEDANIAIMTSFSPIGNKEVLFIFKNSSSLSDLDDKGIEDFSECLIKILKGYKDLRMNAFNLSSFSAPMGENLGYYLLNAKIISRPRFGRTYTNDAGFMERFQREWVIEDKPENMAIFLKSAFDLLELD